MSLLNVYLAINWLPTSLQASGFTRPQAAAMTSLYHVGGVIGTYAIGLLMDRLGAHRMVLVALMLAAIGFYRSRRRPTLRSGHDGDPDAGRRRRHRRAVGATALASMTYPVAMRATGLGWALGVGRVGSIVAPPSSASCWRLRPMHVRSTYGVGARRARHARRRTVETPERAGPTIGRRGLTTGAPSCAMTSASNASPRKKRSPRKT